ncbi:MAG TPA: hypothetical protein V6D34_17875 [Candidatus Sericytochromatia bacterium]
MIDVLNASNHCSLVIAKMRSFDAIMWRLKDTRSFFIFLRSRYDRSKGYILRADFKPEWYYCDDYD